MDALPDASAIEALKNFTQLSILSRSWGAPSRPIFVYGKESFSERIA